jgi:lipid II:glycine glycyltransferase (peptidoglycan interpeptide bridge formation enzyme)
MYNSIFQKAWWLDAVAPGKWEAAKVKQGDDTIARWPYVIEKKRGYVILTQPPLTQTVGPWLRPSKAKYAKMLAEQKDLMNALIDQLPPFDYFSQNFHYSITNWLPFYWQGFSQTTRYTYVIDDLSDLNKVWDGFLPNIRTDIKKAQNRFGVEVCTDLEVDTFIDVNELTFMRQGQKLYYSRDFIRRVDNACVENNARKIFFGRDKEGKIHAAVYVIWDENSAYYLMGGGDPELRNSGATSLCIWEAIKFASGITKKFDFEGSMVEPIERFFRAFGAKQVPYFSLSKRNSRFALLRQAAGIIKSAVLGN